MPLHVEQMLLEELLLLMDVSQLFFGQRAGRCWARRWNGAFVRADGRVHFRVRVARSFLDDEKENEGEERREGERGILG